jgi:hypothetical protein
MAENGIAMKSEGNMFATEKSRILQMRKPVASMIMPPTAVKGFPDHEIPYCVSTGGIFDITLGSSDLPARRSLWIASPLGCALTMRLPLR